MLIILRDTVPCIQKDKQTWVATFHLSCCADINAGVNNKVSPVKQNPWMSHWAALEHPAGLQCLSLKALHIPLSLKWTLPPPPRQYWLAVESWRKRWFQSPGVVFSGYRGEAVIQDWTKLKVLRIHYTCIYSFHQIRPISNSFTKDSA